MNRYYNPFQTQELRYPKAFHEDVLRFTQTRSEAGERIDPDDSPFPRYVDMWLLAVVVGAHMGKRVPVKRENTHKFIEGSIFQGDPWRVELLELLAIGFTGDPQIIRDPREVIQLANDLAAAGMPEVVEMLRGGRAKPIWNLSDRVLELLEVGEGTPRSAIPTEGPEAEGSRVAARSLIEDVVGAQRGEGKQLEFKASMRYDLEKGAPGKEVQKGIARTIAAFLNTEGGSLVIGLTDEPREVVGIEADLKSLQKKGTLDGFELAFRNILREYLPTEVGPAVDLEFVEVEDKTLAVARCDSYHRPVFFIEGKDETFFVRSGNSTQPLTSRAAMDYIKRKWPSA